MRYYHLNFCSCGSFANCPDSVLYWQRTHLGTIMRYISLCPVARYLTFACLGSGSSLWSASPIQVAS